MAKAVAIAGSDEAPLPVSAGARQRVGVMLDRFDLSYEMPWYSPNRCADQILVQIERLRREAAKLDGQGIDDAPEAWGDLFLEVGALIALSAPILIDLATTAKRAGSFDGPLVPAAFEVSEVRPFTPPLLPCEPVDDRSRALGPAEVDGS
jgi:methionyl-tRNA synthetase